MTAALSTASVISVGLVTALSAMTSTSVQTVPTFAVNMRPARTMVDRIHATVERDLLMSMVMGQFALISMSARKAQTTVPRKRRAQTQQEASNACATVVIAAMAFNAQTSMSARLRLMTATFGRSAPTTMVVSRADASRATKGTVIRAPSSMFALTVRIIAQRTRNAFLGKDLACSLASVTKGTKATATLAFRRTLSLSVLSVSTVPERFRALMAKKSK